MDVTCDSESILENESCALESNVAVSQSDKAKGDIVCSKEEIVNLENSKPTIIVSQGATLEDGKEVEVKSFEVPSEPSASVKDTTIKNDASISQPLMSAGDEEKLNSVLQNGFENSTECQTTDTIAERVSFFAEKISKISQKYGSEQAKNAPSVSPGGVGQNSESEQKQKVEGIANNISSKDLEQSFIKALDIVNSENKTEESTDTLAVPSIQITEASDREDTSSEDDDTKPKSELVDSAVKTIVENDVEDPSSEKMKTEELELDLRSKTASTSLASQSEEKTESEISAEERKVVFYISSSDLPAEPPQEPTENENDIIQSPGTVDETVDSPRSDGNFQSRRSCLRSKTLHGATFLAAFVVSITGCIIYGFAYIKKIPDFCEILGLIIAIIAGIVGAFSCFCYSCLEAFPRLSRDGYERIPEGGYIPSLPAQNETENASAQNLDDSWSSEKERAFRRQNGMSSTRTSASSLKSEDEYLVIKKDVHKELVDKVGEVKRELIEVMDVIDSFSNFMSKLEQVDKVSKMESGMAKGF